MIAATREQCLALDAADPLARFRDLFHLRDGLIYLDGNSLGAQPQATPGRLAELQAQWADHLVAGWLDDAWMESPRRLGAKLATFLGARQGEIVIADSTSVCLFKVLVSALGLASGRGVILTEAENFPSDLYVAQGVVETVGGNATLRVVPRAQLLESLDADVAVVMLTHVDYRSGEMHDMGSLTRAAHEAGALAIWDLCHSAGAVSVDLIAADADFAVGCGYKFLNGGPGAPAFLHAAERHHEAMRNPISGWLGHADPFVFDSQYRAAPGIAQMISGSPSVLSIAALEVAVDIWLDADMAAVREKSVALSQLFIERIEDRCGDAGFTLVSPRDVARRGSQVSWHHAEGYGIVRALIDRDVVGDFRDPDICRFGITPLYQRYVDIWDAVDRLVDVLESDAHRAPQHRSRLAIT